MASNSRRHQRSSRRTDYRKRRRHSGPSTKVLQSLASIEARVNAHTSGEETADYLPAIFTYFPQLIGKIPWTSLRGCENPSLPLQLRRSQHLFGHNYIFWKEEALDSDFLPDNAARKLEFIFGEMLESSSKVKKVTVSDFVDSAFGFNAVQLAKALGLKSELFLLKSKLTATSLRRIHQLKADGIKTRFFDKASSMDWAHKRKRFWGKLFPSQVLEFGGGNSRAALAYLSAMLEIKNFVENQELPELDFIFVPVDTGMTFLGLELGRKLVGYKNTKIIGLSTRHDPELLRDRLARIGKECLGYLSGVLHQKIGDNIGPQDFQILPFEQEDIHSGLRWMNRFLELENKCVDLLRTTPALMKMSRFLRENKIEDKKILFWNTFSGVPVNELSIDIEKIKWPSALKNWERTPEVGALSS